jgi:sugar lactone lactonase YvrE
MARPHLLISSVSKRSLATGALCLGAWIFSHSASFAEETYKWSVQYLVDNSQPVFDRPQGVFPRINRGLALSPDGKCLYATYLHGFDHTGEVRRIRLDEPGYEEATLNVLPGIAAKAVAVDPDGRVYLSSRDEIAVYDNHLRVRQFGVDTPNCEGLALTREGRQLVLYATSRTRNVLARFEIETRGNLVVNSEAKGLTDQGEMKIPGAKGLRGIAIDSKGRIWMADTDGNQVFRVDSSGKNLVSKPLKSPLALAFDGNRCFITQGRENQITITDLDLNELGTLKVPWQELALSPTGNNHLGALAGIVMLPGQGFYVANEGGQTAGQRSTYGKEDSHSGTVQGKFYADTSVDDNEPILHATKETLPPQQ